MSEERNHFNTYCQQRYVARVAECWMKNYYHLTRFKDFKFQVYIPNQKKRNNMYVDIEKEHFGPNSKLCLNAGCDTSFWLLLFLLWILLTAAAGGQTPSWGLTPADRHEICIQDLLLGHWLYFAWRAGFSRAIQWLLPASNIKLVRTLWC